MLDFIGWETEDAKFEAEFEKVLRALRGGGGGAGEVARSEVPGQWRKDSSRLPGGKGCA